MAFWVSWVGSSQAWPTPALLAREGGYQERRQEVAEREGKDREGPTSARRQAPPIHKEVGDIVEEVKTMGMLTASLEGQRPPADLLVDGPH